jgi:hypothetical protein
LLIITLVSNPLYDSPDHPSKAASQAVESVERLTREVVGDLSREDALDALELLRERLLAIEQERT